MLDGYGISVARVPILVQPTVTFPIRDHVNILQDYKKREIKKLFPAVAIISLTCWSSFVKITNSFKMAARA